MQCNAFIRTRSIQGQSRYFEKPLQLAIVICDVKSVAKFKAPTPSCKWIGWGNVSSKQQKRLGALVVINLERAS